MSSDCLQLDLLVKPLVDGSVREATQRRGLRRLQRARQMPLLERYAQEKLPGIDRESR